MIALARFLLLALLSRVPAVLSARLLARIARRPLRLALGLLLQPLLALGADYLARRITVLHRPLARATLANDGARRRDTLMVAGRVAASGQSSRRR